MQTLAAGELILEPLVVGHAEAMFKVLTEPELYRYLDYPSPPSIEHLRTVYAGAEARKSPDGSQLWLNWVVRRPGQPPVGYVQATVTAEASAWVGYVFSTEHWGRGYATQAPKPSSNMLPLPMAFLAFSPLSKRRTTDLFACLSGSAFMAPLSASWKAMNFPQRSACLSGSQGEGQNAL